ncbi:hypothetical protein [Campylobacter sp. 19-13652]|uniref:hypothetical protein n=1 Tax=Campylobacter sp. 19-13652 TaxID=2840180 RepID=UPI001C784AC5|nr:hypothetical protein [Campylobacter sp. 19-13652]BCX79929.1 phosphatidylserine decarboxylase [Campylobacter sp. 19-13652]
MRISKYFVKSGLKVLRVALLALIFAFIFSFGECFFSLVFIVFVLIYLERDKKINQTNLNGIYSPISGVVKIIEIGEFNGKKCLKVTIKKSLFSGNIICPFNAKFIELKKRHGLFMCKHIKTADFLSERALFIFSLKNQPVGLRLIAGAFSLSLETNEPKNERYINAVKAGSELGFMSSGEIELLLPLNTQISLSVSERVKKSALIGYLRS